MQNAWRDGSIADEQPAGSFPSTLDADHEAGELPEQAHSEHRDTAANALDHVEHGEQLQSLQVLKPAERRALYLTGLGYSYAEVGRLTGATYTAVNRRITAAPRCASTCATTADHAVSKRGPGWRSTSAAAPSGSSRSSPSNSSRT